MTIAGLALGRKAHRNPENMSRTPPMASKQYAGVNAGKDLESEKPSRHRPPESDTALTTVEMQGP